MTRLPDTLRASAAVATAALLAAACGGARARPAAPSAAGACIALPASSTAADSASIVLTWPVAASNAPVPANPGERFVFAHAYETLVEVDCTGRLTPALARSWAAVEGTTRWRLVLRDGARFWNGDPLTAGDVIASWRATGEAAQAPLARRVAETATVVDDSTVEVACEALAGAASGEVRAGSGDCPLLAALGDAELAIRRRDAKSRWPEGTGAHRIRDARPDRPGRSPPHATLLLDPVHGDPVRGDLVRGDLVRGAGQHLMVHLVQVSEARDLVDAGADLLLTEDPALADYAAARAGAALVPLAWSRTWVLLTPPRGAVDPGSRSRDSALASRDSMIASIDSATASIDSVMARTRAFRSALARDAVRADARAAESSHWWADAAGCEMLTGSSRSFPASSPPARPAPSAPARAPLVVFRRDEPVARALAERLVALAAAGGGGLRDTSLALLAPGLLEAGGRATAAALAPDDFARALREASGLAFVVSLPRQSLAPCRDIARLYEAAPWLAPAGAPPGAGARVLPVTPAARALAPLIDTRLHAVARRDRLGLVMAWDSTVTLAPPSTAAGARP